MSRARKVDKLGVSEARSLPMPRWDTHVELPQARLFPPGMQANCHFQPLNDPVWTDAYEHLRDDDPVIGLYLNRQARALPWWIMKNHHVANLAFDDMPVLVRFARCAAAHRPFARKPMGVA